MKKKRLVKILAIVILSGVVIGGSLAFYLFNMPHRNIQNSKADYSTTVSALVSEYLDNAGTANEKYLSDDGDSKILAVQGVVQEIRKDMKGQTVLLLKSEDSPAGVNATFALSEEEQIKTIGLGEKLTVKGVIQSGAAYDSDMELYRHVVLNNCSLL